jgi:hypothetical protein
MTAEIEKHLAKLTGVTTVFLAVMFAIAAFGFFASVPNFWGKYGIYSIYLIIAVIVNGSALWYARANRKGMTCMTGMMVGMTMGMISGFMFGAIVGATNGMFVGSLAGIIVGMGLGAWTGKCCCGIMGTMEGSMAGLMSGVMGAMTSVMLFNDFLWLFLPILIAGGTIIQAGLVYLVRNENPHRDVAEIRKGAPSIISHISLSFILMIALSFVIVYGPRSFLFLGQ